LKSFYLTVRRLLLTWESFDPDACGLVARWAAVYCAVAVAAAKAILLLEKDGTNCPGWHSAQAREGLWVTVIFSSILAGWWCWVTFFRWEYFSRTAVEEQTLPRNATLPAGSIFVFVAIGWCGFCSLPLLMLFGELLSLVWVV
jgi:hypothetical protein